MIRRSIVLTAFALAVTACGAPPEPTTKQGPTTNQGEAQPEPQASQSAPSAGAAGIYALQAESLGGEQVALSDFDGKVSLVVNVASECGYTRQYGGLQALHSELKDKGFQVLGFPSNEFGGQEPGTADEIQKFCSDKFGVDFPMFAKIKTKAGEGQSPVYAALTTATGEQPGWNFCKYLVGRDGKVIGFYKSGVAPDSAELRGAINAALAN